MKLIEVLKAQGLNEETISKIQNDMKENKIYETSIENADERYNKLKTQKDDLKSQLDTANTTITGLKDSNKDNETLQTTIKEHETTIATLKTDSETKIKELTLNNAINNKLANVDDKYKKLLETQFNKEKLSVKEDGTIEGLEDQFKAMTETYSEWFKPEIPNDTGGLGNFNRTHGAGGNGESLGERLAKQATSNSNKHNYFGGNE